MAAGRQHLSSYIRHPFYAAMFAASGHPIEDDTVVPESLITDLIVTGDDDAVGRRLIELLDLGFDELLISNLAVGDKHALDRRLLNIIREL